MATEFDHYAAKGNELLHRIEDGIELPKEQAFRILRAVLHALRNLLPVQESMHLLAQLPMALKSIYVESWKLTDTGNRSHRLSEFIDEIRRLDDGLAAFDLGDDESARRKVGVVLRVLGDYISPGQLRDVIACLPDEVKQFLRQNTQVQFSAT
ncbi:MAG TPA: DUF2267 domain-containing protein [Chitinophagaceae bacterium]